MDALNSAAARQVDIKRRELEALDNDLRVKKVQTEAEGKKAIASINEKNNRDQVEISAEGDRLSTNLRQQHHDQIQQLQKNHNDAFEKLAADTAEQFKTMNETAKNSLNQLHLDNMGKLSASALQAEDPFYRLKSFDAQITDGEKAYKLTLKLAPQEARNLFLTSEGNIIKLSLARSYNDKAEVSPQHTNKTYNYQTITESYQLANHVEAKGATREYTDGTLTITIPKV